MPLRRFRCPGCGAERETLRNSVPTCNHNQEELGQPIAVFNMDQILVAPQSKMMETTDSFKGKSRMKNQTKILKERARNFTRDHEADEMIELNQKNSLQRSGFLTSEGKRRKKVDDL